MFTNIFLYFLLFIIGTCMGSFLNVVIDRWPKDQSIVRGRSHCDFCKKSLLPYDLIPVLSFIMLHGRCRYCHHKLSLQYPLVEFITGILFVSVWYLSRFNNFSIGMVFTPLSKLYLLIIVLYFIVIFMVDLKFEIILDNVINSAIIITFIYQIGWVFFFLFNQNFIINHDGWNPFLASGSEFIIHLAAGLITAFFFYFLILVSRGRGLGSGDVKLGFWLGLLLGIYVVPGLFIAFISGALIGLSLVVVEKKRFGQTIPLAPFLISGSFIALFWGDKIINWYLQRLL